MSLIIGFHQLIKLLASLGAIIVVLKGIERIWLPEEKWISYRKAAEAMRRERKLYVESIAPYADKNEEKAYSLFVSRDMKIRAEERSDFWGLDEESELGQQDESEKPK